MFLLFPGGKKAMDQTMRDLTADELERVAGGDSHIGEGMCTAPHLILKIAGITIIKGTDRCDDL
jgi:hypothetical protein